ncbi:MAG TPA: hypothetical protein VIE45_09595, partial [Streptosporangiaceae bacterium]
MPFAWAGQVRGAARAPRPGALPGHLGRVVPAGACISSGAVARLELVATLRELGLGLAEVHAQARTPDFVARVLEHAGPAAGHGVPPESDEGGAVLDRILAGTPGDQRRPQLLEHLEAGTDARAERYWQLLGII